MSGKITSLKQAEKNIGSLSSPGKMPNVGWSISAHRCHVGSKLVPISGSVCAGCYALKNFYAMDSTQIALERRYNAWNSNRQLFVDSMIYILKNKACYRTDNRFRWFDSGDIQSAEMLDDIADIAKACPSIRFWLPSREHQVISKWLKNNECPSNLVIRVSNLMLNQSNNSLRKHFGITSSVYDIDLMSNAPSDAKECGARFNNNECGTCDNCWNPDVVEVYYPNH